MGAIPRCRFIPILSTRPRQETMKEGKEEKRAAVFWVF